MEFIRMGVVYVHLIACCVAIGLVLTSDIAMVKDLFNENRGQHDHDHLPKLQRIVSLALVGLWITGFTIIGLDLSVKGFEYLTNPKLQAKVAVVALLTFNGYILHKAVLPGLQKAGTLLDLEFKPRMIAIFTGVVSGVSWFSAALLGVAKPLNWKYSFVEILGGLPVVIVLGFMTMVALVAFAKVRRQENRQLAFPM